MKSMNRTLATVMIICIIIVVGLVIYLMVNKWHRNQMIQDRQRAQNECMEVIHNMEADMEQLRGQLEAERRMRPGHEEFPTVFGTPAPGPEVEALPVDCKQAEEQMLAFYKYLDSRAYFAEQEITDGSAGYFRECAALLMAHPPINIAEMQEMLRLVKNVTHFYRVLGKKRLMLAKNILSAEDRVIEPAMGILFALVAECGQPLPGDVQPLPVERLYDYAGYFLNTLGGRSYLLRRESKVRMLVNYYAILIVDRANDEKFNKYGIDLRPYIDYLFYDISNQRGLAYRERYLTRLTALRDKYM
ncbi:MAG: hypothetical protein WBY88_03490 [Desulfosarcina sp.]